MDLFPADHPLLAQAFDYLDDEPPREPSDRQKSWGPLHWFVLSKINPDDWREEAARVQARVARGMDPSVPTAEGDTPLHFCGWQGKIEEAQWLLALGARTDVVNGKGNLPCHQALRKGYPFLALLLLKGADATQPDHQGISAIGHWVRNFARSPTPLPDPVADEGRLWAWMRSQDRAAWEPWEGSLPPAWLMDLKRHQRDVLEQALPQAAPTQIPRRRL